MVNSENNNKFGEVLGNWTKRDSTKGNNTPFIVRLGSPRSSFRKKVGSGKAADNRCPTLVKHTAKKRGSDATDTTEMMNDSSHSSTSFSPKTSKFKVPVFVSPLSSPSVSKGKRGILGDRMKKFESKTPAWLKRKPSVSFMTPPGATSDKDDMKSSSKTFNEPTQDGKSLVVSSATTVKPRPSLMKQSSAQRSSRNHLLRVQSRNKNLGKSVRRNKSNVCAKRMNSLKAFTPPVFKKNYVEKQLIFKALTSNFVFEDLAPVEIKAFVQAFEKVDVSKGDTVIKQGDVGDYFYIIAEGDVTFNVNGQPVGSANKGKSFGELALLYTSPRAATVVVTSEGTKLFRVDQKTFRYIMQSQTKEMESEKLTVLKKLPFLKDFVESDLLRLGSAMTPRKFDEGDYIVRKGESGDAFYIVQDGQLTVTDISVGDTTYDDVTLGPGDYFGERSLVTSDSRAANVIGVTSGTLFSIDRYTFEKVLGNFSRVILKSQDKTKLEGVKVLKTANLDPIKYEILTGHILDKTYISQNTIFEEGRNTDPAIYLVREGQVQLSSKDGSRSEVIEAGGYFGDDQLLADVRSQVSTFGTILPDYTATVSGESTCVCGVLTLADCRLTFDTKKLVDEEDKYDDDDDGPAKRSSSRDSIMSSRRSQKRFSTAVRDSLRSSVHGEESVESLKRHSVLGEGQFGEVWLVSADFEEESESFALKIQSKDNPDDNGSLDVIRREAEVLQSLDHPCVVDLIQTYETEDKVYMLLNLVEGGELWDRMHRQDDDGNWTSGIPHDHAKFYGLVVADTLAYIHSQGVVFRDLKPENILIDDDGYPVIVDFGFAKVCPDKTYTFCGTPNYLAPEVITNRGHAVGVDHWALGVVIYEMLVGENPFFYEGLSQVGLYEAICHEDYYPLPNNVSIDAFDLIDRLLEKDPIQRLGTLSGRERDILTHEWFDGLDLTRLQMREVEAPWIPPSKG